jgi:hypothetical protein
MKRTLVYVLIFALILIVAYAMRERYVDYAEALNDVGQTAGYTNLNTPAGTQNTGVGTAFNGATPEQQAQGMAAARNPGTSGTTSSGATTGNTTGGTTTNRQPTSGGTSQYVSPDSQTVSGVPGNNVFGPAFVGLGENNDNGIPQPPRAYPYLYGPKPDSSSLVPGAGIAGPSQAASLADSGVLPSSATTGSGPNSQYFGASRVPGDRDLVPNPYARNMSYTPSSGSSKTEPLPYLTDFSAFGK